MEEILASIRRIIAEGDDAGAAIRSETVPEAANDAGIAPPRMPVMKSEQHAQSRAATSGLDESLAAIAARLGHGASRQEPVQREPPLFLEEPLPRVERQTEMPATRSRPQQQPSSGIPERPMAQARPVAGPPPPLAAAAPAIADNAREPASRGGGSLLTGAAGPRPMAPPVLHPQSNAGAVEPALALRSTMTGNVPAAPRKDSPRTAPLAHGNARAPVAMPRAATIPPAAEPRGGAFLGAESEYNGDDVYETAAAPDLEPERATKPADATELQPAASALQRPVPVQREAVPTVRQSAPTTERAVGARHDVGRDKAELRRKYDARFTHSDSGAFAEVGQALAPLVSSATSRQVGQSFGALASAMVKPDPAQLSAMTEKLLKPMLQEWLDENLPTLVERLVREEIERVARGGRR